MQCIYYTKKSFPISFKTLKRFEVYFAAYLSWVRPNLNQTSSENFYWSFLFFLIFFLICDAPQSWTFYRYDVNSPQLQARLHNNSHDFRYQNDLLLFEFGCVYHAQR